MKRVLLFFMFGGLLTYFGVEPNQSVYRFSILRYGAVRDSTVDNTTKIQNAIDSCHAHGGGIVYIPAGTWLMTKIYLSGMPDVSLLGEENGSILKANTGSDTMIVNYNNQFYKTLGNVSGYSGIKNIVLQGKSIAKIGMAMYYVEWFRYENIRIDSCTSIGLVGKGTLTGEFDNVQFYGNPTGAYMDSVNLSPGGLVAPNLLKFNNCRFYYATQWGAVINWSQGAIHFDNCDFEQDGSTHGYNNNGAVFCNQMNSGASGIVFTNCWWEQNKGTNFYVYNTVGNQTYTMIDCQMEANSNASVGVWLGGQNGSSNQTLSLIGTHIFGDSVDIIYTGFSHATLMESTIATANIAANSLWVYEKQLSYNGTTDHIISTATAPLFTLKNGAGTGASYSFDAGSTEAGGTLTVTTGTTPAASDTLGYIGYTGAYWAKTGVACVLSAANANAAALFGNSQVWSHGGGTNAVPYIFTNSTALTASTVYKFNYVITGY